MVISNVWFPETARVPTAVPGVQLRVRGVPVPHRGGDLPLQP
jgi:hypothetical protein